MADLSIFLQQNWILLALALIVITMIMYEEKNSSSDKLRLTPEKAVSLINHEGAKILDLRNREAFKDEHLAGSFNIPFADFSPQHKKLNHVQQSPLILIAASRSEGLKALAQLNRAGKNDVYFLVGGINAWREANLPI